MVVHFAIFPLKHAMAASPTLPIAVFARYQQLVVYTNSRGMPPAQDHPWTPLLLPRRISARERTTSSCRRAVLGLGRHLAPTPSAAPGGTHPCSSLSVWRCRCPLCPRPATPFGRTHRCARPHT